MSFSIVFMYNNEPMNKITKSPSTLFTLTGDLKSDCSIMNPVILVQSTNPINANYAYIAQFNRYYYIKDIVSHRDNLWEISMHTDVLKTFSQGILGSPCIVSKNSDRYNLYLNDSDYKCQQNDMIFTKTFDSGFLLTESRFVAVILGDKEAAS